MYEYASLLKLLAIEIFRFHRLHLQRLSNVPLPTRNNLYDQRFIRGIILLWKTKIVVCPLFLTNISMMA